jgi:uncharacterized protein (TIGR03437 family)
MDAAYTYFNKTVLFLATALLLAVPGRATTPTFNLNGSNSNTLTVTAGIGTAATVNVASSLTGVTEITFSVGVSYVAGDQSWLCAGDVPASGMTTMTLYFQACYSGLPQHSATVTLTATNPASGVPNAVITVAFPGGSGSGGTITATPYYASLTAASGAVANPEAITLTGSSSVAFTVTYAVTTPAGGTWLGAAVTAGYNNTQLPSSITVTATALSLPSGTYNGTVTVTPTGGGGATVINVTFTVGTGAGSGNLTANLNPITWSYTSGSGSYPSSSVTLTSSTGASGFSTTVNSSTNCAGNSNCWLYTNPTNGSISSGFEILPNATITSLGTGNYTGYIYVTATDGSTLTITVNLTVNGGSTNGISWQPDPVTITAALNGSTQQTTVTLTSATAGTFNSVSISGSGLSISGVSTISTTSASVVVYGNPYNLPANTYVGSLTVYFTPTSGSEVSPAIPISFVVGSGGITTTSGTVAPTSLMFAYSTSSTSAWPTLPAQTIQVTGSGTLAVGTVAYTAGQTTGWLTATPSGATAPGTISVTVAAATLTTSTTPYTATIPVTVAGVASSVSVSLLVTSNPVLVTYPGVITFNYTAGGANPSSPLYLYASDNSADAVTASSSTSWLTVGSPTAPNTNNIVSVQGNNLSSLANGVYTGSVLVTATALANSPVTVPVVLIVTGSTATGGSLTLGSLSTFYATQGGSTPASQTLSVSPSTNTTYSASATSTGNWLSISPSGNSLTTSSYPSLTVSVVNLSSLTAAGSPYYGTITLVANSVTQTVQVTLVVSSTSTGGSGNVTVTANGVVGTPSLSFTYQVGGTAPTAQTLQVSSASGSSPVSFTISSSATWLSAGVTNGTSLNTPVTFTVNIATPITLTPSSTPYPATITITPTGGTVVTVPVTLTVNAAPTVTATSTPLAFTYQVGGASPATQTISVSGGGQSLGFSATVTSGNNWLSVSPPSGTTPTTGTASLIVTATPGTLSASATPYTGTILVVGTGTAGGSTSITVTLTITAPLPTINSVVNAASFAKGAVSPGEIVTLFGTAMGPATAAYAAIDPTTGKLATTIGGVQVFFNGILAPMIYVSATQISAIVPYEMAPIASPSVWVKYVGQTSNAYQLNSATTAPGIFTQNASGSGPGAILNQDGVTLNGPGHPAAKGSIVTVYLTGEGQTSPQGVTGAITTATLPPPQVTPAPLLPVGVLINGLPALPVYTGEAPGLAAGLMQLNVQIPTNAQSGALSIQVSIGSNISQVGVTVSVQ